MSITPRFLIKKPNKLGSCLIYMQAIWNGSRLLYSTGESVALNLWDRKRQRMKNNQSTTKDGLNYINDLLNSMESVAVSGYRKESLNGIPTVSQVRKYLDDFFELNMKKEKVEQSIPTLYELIDMFISNKILYKGQPKSIATIKSYKTTLRHLKEFEKEKNFPIRYDTISLQFSYDFISHLRDKGMQQNTLNKNIGVVKAFLSEAVELGYTKCIDFKKKRFGISPKLVDMIYLKEDEILKIYNYDLSHSKSLENVRDAFVIACCTGFRFSDFSTLKTDHIQEIDGELYIKKTTLKTREEVIVPINGIVMEILKKYKDTKNGLPKVVCNQVFNRHIKVVCQLAGLTETGRLSEEPEKQVYECVSTHTARRSFATNAFIAGAAPYDIMKMTSHKSEKSFMRYIRLSKLDAAKRFSKHIQLNKSKATLRVAI
jgi:integrase